MHIYNDDFYEYQSKGSLSSAEVIIDILLDYLDLESALDIGCGIGSWLKVYKSHGLAVVGLDGSYINKEQLLIDDAEFISVDLTKGIKLDRSFSIVQSLEVAEHIPAQYADSFVQLLVDHSDCVLFSAASPGQGGEVHVNEQTLEYWRKKFEARGYIPFDLIRPLVKKSNKKNLVEKWYRYNSVLYIKKDSELYSSEKLQAFKVKMEMQLPIFSDLLWDIRKLVVNLLPKRFITPIAKFNASRIAIQQRWSR